MTHYNDQLRQGAAYFGLQGNWNNNRTNGMPLPSSPADTETRGVPHTQVFYYQVGQASTAGTATAGRYYYSATGATGGITLSSFVADVPRTVRIFSSVNLSTVTFTLVGVDGYEQTVVWSGAGPTGNTLGNSGSYVDTSVAFLSLNTASGSGSTGTTPFGISNSDGYGLPYRLVNAGMGLGVFVDGATATLPPTFTAGSAATGTPTATTGDVRGIVTLPTALIANDSRYFTIGFITPNVNTTVATDDKARSFGTTPYSG